MAHTIAEQVAQALKTQLETITVANGYENGVHAVIRPRRTGEMLRPQNLDIIMLQSDMEPDPVNNIVGFPPGLAWIVPFSLDLVIRQTESSTLPMDQIINNFVGDVQKAVMEDVTFGNLAHDTRLGTVEFSDSASGFEGATVWVEIFIVVKENDPFTLFV